MRWAAAADDHRPGRSGANNAFETYFLVAATDGHGKNLSIHNRAGGAYGMTPLYDVLSAWPIIGHGKNQLPLEARRFAQTLTG